MAGEMVEWRPLSELRHRVDQMIRDLSEGGEEGWAPSIDVIRREDAIVIRADIPGIKPEDVKVTIEDDVLTVAGEHEESSEEERDRYVRRERRYGSFSRSMPLPRGVKAEDVEATTEHGVLEVTVPLPSEEKPQTVEIKPKAKGS
ncbi:MAG: Hsp20/alpha crystallin family protein [Syntrophothermus sp.]